MIDTTPYLTHEYSGLGCWNIVRLVYKDTFNLELPDYDHIAHASQVERAIIDNVANWLPISKGDEKDGDLILFLMGRRFYHIGVVLPRWRFLHVCRKNHFGVVERYNDPSWRNIIEGFYRHVSMCS